jgi:starch phosphorylase
MGFANRSGESLPAHLSQQEGIVAYFSMEIAVSPGMPTYSGGLGVLAGDTLRSAADLGLGMAAVTLLHRKGYFRQILDAAGVQSEVEQPWDFETALRLQPPVVEVAMEGRVVAVRAWRYDLQGVHGHVVPIYFLDTDLERNEARDRALTDHLYGGDSDYRLRQEAVLGLGGARMLEALGCKVRVYHMNEGHAALLTAALMERRLGGDMSAPIRPEDVGAVRHLCVFTTHTPVPAGHDRFSPEQAGRILGGALAGLLERMGARSDGAFNLTCLALACSRFVNGVAMQHGRVSREMFPQYEIDAITNGVHAATWLSAPLQELFDRRLTGWRRDNLRLRYAIEISPGEIAGAHAESKRALLEMVNRSAGAGFDSEVFTMGFARRAATYNRADLLFSDPERLARCAERFGGIQILFSGKAHPQDEPGKSLIRRIFEAKAALRSHALKVAYLENYEWSLGARLTAGVDLWLNTPRRPLEASGTSGMKAALNGVPSLSILDGWWMEGCIEGITGWAIPDLDTPEEEAAALYAKLESSILPLYAGDRPGWNRLMRSTIALNGSYFNTHRMLEQYAANAYFPAAAATLSRRSLEPAFSH